MTAARWGQATTLQGKSFDYSIPQISIVGQEKSGRSKIYPFILKFIIAEVENQ